MFSRPVSSGLKPVPTSSRLPTRPRISARPVRRRRDPREDLQQRRLARAVASDDAQHLPLGHLERDVPQRPELLDGAMVLLARDPLHGVHHRFAQRAVRRLVLTEAVLLRKPFDLDRDRHQIVSAKRRLRRPERGESDDEQHAGDSDADCDLARVGLARVEHGPAPARDHGGHRVEREDPLPLHRDLVDGEHHAREQRQDLEEHGDHVADVPVADVDGGEQQADAEHRHHREQDPKRRRQGLPAGRPRVVLPDEKDEHGQADDEVDERHTHPTEREQRPREVDLRDEGKVREEAEAREAESGGEVLHRQHAGDDEAGVGGVARREVRELAEDDHVDERGERRHENRPGDSEERLLVADGDVAPDERPEELAVMPELADVEAREPARRPDHRHAACRIEVDPVARGRRSHGRGVDGARRRSLLFERGLGSTHPGMLAATPARAVRRKDLTGAVASTPGCSSVSATAVSVDIGTNVGRSAR